MSSHSAGRANDHFASASQEPTPNAMTDKPGRLRKSQRPTHSDNASVHGSGKVESLSSLTAMDRQGRSVGENTTHGLHDERPMPYTSSTGAGYRRESFSRSTQPESASQRTAVAPELVRAGQELVRSISSMKSNVGAQFGNNVSGHRYQAQPQQSMEIGKYVQQQLSQARARNTELEATLSAKDKAIETSFWRLSQAQARISELETIGSKQDIQIEECVQQLSHSQARTTALESEQEQWEASLREIQAKAFKHFDDPGWKPQCNDDISRGLDHLETALKSWSKIHSIPRMSTLNQSTPPSLADQVLAVVDGFGRPADDMPLMGVPDDKAWILIQAFLLHHMYRDVLDKPFFGLHDRVQAQQRTPTDHESSSLARSHHTELSRRLDRDSVETFQVLYDEFIDCNEQEAIAWRVQTLRQLNPPPTRKLDIEPNRIAMYDKTARGRNDAAERLARSYLESAIRPFLKDAEQDDTVLSLKNIILQAAELSLFLWTQKLSLGPKYLQDPALGETFAHDNAMVQAHQLQNKYLHDDPGLFDGAKVLMVTHPALVRYGNDGTEDSGSRAVLKKATCWMAPPIESSR